MLVHMPQSPEHIVQHCPNMQCSEIPDMARNWTQSPEHILHHCPNIRGSQVLDMAREDRTEGVKEGPWRSRHNLEMTGDGVAQWVESRTRDPKTGGSNPACVRSTRTICESFSGSNMVC